MDTDLTSALQFQCDEITPPFSIIITCYNQAAFIREAVESALNQSFMEKQIIVVDDFSSDGSIQLLRQYNDAIRLIALQRNVGAARARNLGINRERKFPCVFRRRRCPDAMGSGYISSNH